MIAATDKLRPDVSPLVATDTLLLFGYAPTGLGHIRVTDALWRGLGVAGSPRVIGAGDKGLAAAHRLLTQRRWAQAFFEWTQAGWRQQLGTPLYRRSMRGNTKGVEAEVRAAIKASPVPPKRVVVLATHYDVAHRVAAAKERLQRETNTPIFLAVQVTDDSPQHVWMVPGADVLYVPSVHTRDALLEYAQRSGLDAPPMVVLPYPIPAELSEPLSAQERAERTAALSPSGDAPTRVAVPISGAAAGLLFLAPLIDTLGRKSPRYRFDIVSRVAPYTRPFLEQRRAAGNTVHSGTRNHEVIDAYRRLYDEQVIALELTKPSEQAFKTMVGSAARGGAVVLFAPPVGRQERDNLEFLTRHHLLPDATQHRALQALWTSAKPFTDANERLRSAARGWRCLRLPQLGAVAAEFAHWALTSGLLAELDHCERPSERRTEHAAEELDPRGVARFWDDVARRVGTPRA